jgi:hypothetical protein
MEKVKSFTMLAHHDVVMFNYEINCKLAIGLELFGTPRIWEPVAGDSSLYAQAMILYETEKK